MIRIQVATGSSVNSANAGLYDPELVDYADNKDSNDGPVVNYSGNPTLSDDGGYYKISDYHAFGSAAAGMYINITNWGDITSPPDAGRYKITAITGVAPYVDSITVDESTGNTGTTNGFAGRIGGALGDIQDAIDLWSEGDIRVEAGTYTITDSNKISLSGLSTGAEAWLRLEGCNTDGTLCGEDDTWPKLDASGSFASSCALVSLAGTDYVVVGSLELDGNDIANMNYGIHDGNAATTNVSLYNIDSHHFDYGIYIQNGSSLYFLVYNLICHNNSNRGMHFTYYTFGARLRAYSNGSYGIFVRYVSSLSDIIAYDNSTYNIWGYSKIVFLSNIVADNATYGLQAYTLNNTASCYQYLVANTVLTACTNGLRLGYGDGYDCRDNGTVIINCISTNNTNEEYFYSSLSSGRELGNDDYGPNNQIDTALSFTDFNGNDYRLDTDGATFTSYYDVDNGQIISGALGPDSIGGGGVGGVPQGLHNIESGVNV